jgi:hypothetical protein
MLIIRLLDHLCCFLSYLLGIEQADPPARHFEWPLNLFRPMCRLQLSTRP